MKRRFRTFFLIFFTGIVVGSFFFVQRQFADLPEHLQQVCKAHQISLTFKNVEAKKFSVHLSEVTASSPALNYRLYAEAADLAAKGTWSFPFFKLSLNLKHPDVSESSRAPASLPEPDGKGTSAGADSWLNSLFSLGQLEFTVENGSAEFAGIKDLNGDFKISDLAFGPHGLEKASLRHEILISGPTTVAYLRGLYWQGHSSFTYPDWNANQHKLTIGPINLNLNATWNVETHHWQSQLTLPETILQPNSPILSPNAQAAIKNLSGTIALNSTIKGIGLDADKLNIAGTASAKNFEGTLSLPDAKGKVKGEFFGEIHRDSDLNFTTKLQADFTDAEFDSADNFRKPKGVALVVEAEAVAKANQINVSKAQLKFNNLALEAHGDIQSNGKHLSNLQFSLAPTSLKGWEQFMPRFASLHTQGTVQASAQYSGPLSDLNEGTLDLNLAADQVCFPVLSAWLRNTPFSVEGPILLQSKTQLAYSAGKLRVLASQTKADLGLAEIEAPGHFHKPAGTAFNADISIVSKGKRAEIQRAKFQLADLNAQAKGKVETFSQPLARLSFSTETFKIPSILRLIPDAGQSAFSELEGSLQIQGNYESPLLTKDATPKYSGEALLKQISFRFHREDQSDLAVNSLSGPIRFDRTKLSSPRLAFSLPSSHGSLSFNVLEFENPQANFSLQADELALSDFVDPKRETRNGIQATWQEAIQRLVSENPGLKKLHLLGDIQADRAVFGKVTTQNFATKLSWDKQNLKLSALSAETLGGTLGFEFNWDLSNGQAAFLGDIKSEKIHVKDLLGLWAPNSMEAASGELSATVHFEGSGLQAPQIEKTLRANGSLSIQNAQVSALRLSQKPLEALSQFPQFGKSPVAEAPGDDLGTLSAGIIIENQKARFTNLLAKSSYFDLAAPQLVVDFDEHISGEGQWFPKETLVSTTAMDALKDDQGHASIPLKFGGNLKAPTAEMEMTALQARLTTYASRKITEVPPTKPSETLSDKAGGDALVK